MTQKSESNFTIPLTIFFLRMTQKARVILQSLIAFFISTVPIILSLLHTICHVLQLQLWQKKEQSYIELF